MSENSSDEITKKVEEMYKKYPYPSPSTNTNQTNELLNLLKIFEMESKVKLENINILDAGTGTGHRINTVAEFYKNCNFLGMDISDRSLEIARELKKQKQIHNIEFQKANLMNEINESRKFDLILCMGVLHHLSNPQTGLKNILKLLNDNGVVFLYLYGKLGGHKRMLNKKLISILLGKDYSDYKLGIKLVRELGLNKFEYGWNLNFENEEQEDSLIVDYLLHANETLYDFDDINKLLKKSGLYGYSCFGITTGTQGYIFDARINKEKKLAIPQTHASKYLKAEYLKNRYETLELEDKYRIMDLLFEPNGYTIIGFTKQAYERLSSERLKENFIKN